MYLNPHFHGQGLWLIQYNSYKLHIFYFMQISQHRHYETTYFLQCVCRYFTNIRGRNNFKTAGNQQDCFVGTNLFYSILSKECMIFSQIWSLMSIPMFSWSVITINTSKKSWYEYTVLYIADMQINQRRYQKPYFHQHIWKYVW